MKRRFLSGNAIKIIGAITMVSDHIGYVLFPDEEIFRIIGRLAFPLFAFMISEGARYTKNRVRYFLTLLCFGIVCQLPLIVLMNEYHFNIFVTFALSVLGIYALDNFKKQAFAREREALPMLTSLALGLVTFGVIFALTRSEAFHIDYGFYGILLPVFASLPNLSGAEAPGKLARLDCLPVRILCMLIPTVLLAYTMAEIQWFSLISLPLLFLYSGKRGQWKMKYFFYVFYPLHMVIIYGISLLI